MAGLAGFICRGQSQSFRPCQRSILHSCSRPDWAKWFRQKHKVLICKAHILTESISYMPSPHRCLSINCMLPMVHMYMCTCIELSSYILSYTTLPNSTHICTWTSTCCCHEQLRMRDQLLQTSGSHRSEIPSISSTDNGHSTLRSTHSFLATNFFSCRSASFTKQDTNNQQTSACFPSTEGVLNDLRPVCEGDG